MLVNAANYTLGLMQSTNRTPLSTTCAALVVKPTSLDRYIGEEVRNGLSVVSASNGLNWSDSVQNEKSI